MLATGNSLFPFAPNRDRERWRKTRTVADVVSVDLFAGGGGASLGILWATGRAPIVAVNHCEHAVKIHELNHPTTTHYREAVADVNPRLACRGYHIDLVHLSPDCTDFSRAKGAAPRSTGRRHLADAALDWARDVGPDVFTLENVPEFQQWGPLHPDDHPNPKLRGQPIKSRRGECFKRWCEALRAFGYTVEWRELVCADYGSPTTRKRFFLVARCDGEPIVWPEKTFGEGTGRPWRMVADCIDWSLAACSIFATPEEARAWAKAHQHQGWKRPPRRPLAEKTQRRIAEGMMRYVLSSKRRPFLVCLTHGGRVEDLQEPAHTITAAHRGERAVVEPSLAPVGAPFLDKMYGSALAGQTVEQPSPTITGGCGGGHSAVVTPVLVRAHAKGSDREGSAAGVVPGGQPAPTFTATQEWAVSAPVLVQITQQQSEARHKVRGVDEPVATIVGQAEHALVSVGLINTRNGERVGQTPRVLDLERPMGTITGQGSQGALFAAWLAKHYGGMVGHGLDQPIGTITGTDHHAPVEVELAEPAVPLLGRARAVAAFLIKYHGQGGQWAPCDEPLHTVDATARFSVVQVELRRWMVDGRDGGFYGVEIDGETYIAVVIDGVAYIVVDITMRMLRARELARATGFPDSYVLFGTEEEQIERIGNAVPPHVMEALVRAQFPPAREAR